MMENVRPHCGTPDFGSYDLEFYNSSRGWKEYSTVATTNNNLSPNSELDSSGFSINASTGESDIFIDDLIELADSENLSTTSASPIPSFTTLRPMSTGPVYHSRLHEALTQPPKLPTQPVKCHRCGNELTSKCLMQTCGDDAKCRQCGKDLTAKCILAVCTVQPKTEPIDDYGQFQRQQQPQHQLLNNPRKRVHHYSTPS